MDPVAVAASWLHLLATVTLLGYYAVLAVFLVPVLRRTLAEAQLAATLATIERRALPILIGSLAVFLATGIYLMGADTRYGGIGAIGSSWATVMLFKHVFVVALVGLALVVDALFVRAAAADDAAVRTRTLRRLTTGLWGVTLLAVVILLLTALAQTS